MSKSKVIIQFCHNYSYTHTITPQLRSLWLTVNCLWTNKGYLIQNWDIVNIHDLELKCLVDQQWQLGQVSQSNQLVNWQLNCHTFIICKPHQFLKLCNHAIIVKKFNQWKFLYRVLPLSKYHVVNIDNLWSHNHLQCQLRFSDALVIWKPHIIIYKWLNHL